MKRIRPSLPLIPRLRRFSRDEDGATLVEFAVVVLLFLTLTFAIIDFGRMAYAWSAAQKATQIAARIAAVRPRACPGVPEFHERGSAGADISYGTLCRAGTDVCEDAGIVECRGNDDDPTVNEIFTAIRPLLPAGTEADNLRFKYRFDQNLGFLGGPYVPLVTVDLQCVPFEFATRLDVIIAALSQSLNNPCTDVERGIWLPEMSVTVPGEDLDQGVGTAG